MPCKWGGAVVKIGCARKPATPIGSKADSASARLVMRNPFDTFGINLS
jgi:hypothetical protein